MIHPRSLLIGLIIGTTFILTPLDATAATSLKVELGWNGAYRVGCWSPIYITASDSIPRNAVIEAYIPQDMLEGMRLSQVVPLADKPRTFVLYAPFWMQADDITVTLRDQKTGRRLADFGRNLTDMTAQSTLSPVSQLVVVSGPRTPITSPLVHHINEEYQVDCRIADMARLPSVPIGYDSINLLILDRPDLGSMPVEQQEAIVEWVRIGGQLLVCVSDTPLPASSPILSILPAQVGDNIMLNLSDAALEEAGLPRRFARLGGRQLEPFSGSRGIPLLGQANLGYRRALGLGEVVLLPFDAPQLLFQDPLRAKAFWQGLLKENLTYRKRDDKNAPYYSPYDSTTLQLRSTGANQVLNAVGKVPGVGSFGFGYVVIVMLAMMLIVGPIDWIVLRRLDRQPWTWITTSGWIALVTLGAIYLGRIYKSGDLHFRTMRLIEQADNRIVATIDAAGIYSPRTQDYNLSTPAEGWWQPLTADVGYSAQRRVNDMPFHQSQVQTEPMTLRIPIWNMRFLMSQSTAPAPPMLGASLEIQKRGGQSFLVGTITNRGSAPIQPTMIRVGGLATLPMTVDIAPGTTSQVDVSLETAPKRDPDNPQDIPYSMRRSVGNLAMEDQTPNQNAAGAYFELASTRAARVERILSQEPDTICIYALIKASDTVLGLDPPASVQHHEQYLRALIRRGESNP